MPAKLNPDASGSRKMLELYSLLIFSGKRYTLTNLAERLQCSKATILRLMDDIEQSEIIETGKDGKERWFALKKIQKTQQIYFSHENIQHLALCRDFLFYILPADIRQELDRTVQHTATLITDEKVREYSLASIASSYGKGVIDYTPFQSKITTVMQAIPKKRICNISYYSFKRKEIREFEVAPMRLLAYHESLYVECWRIKTQNEQQIKQPMTLAVHRIQSINPTRRVHTFTDLPRTEDGQFGMMRSSPIRLKIRFAEAVVQYVSERQWSHDQEIVSLPTGEIELSFTSGNEDEAIAWILSFGPNASVLEPSQFREKFINKLRKILEIY